MEENHLQKASIKNYTFPSRTERAEGEVLRAPEPAGLYYFHPDHLGTGTFITDLFGNAYQIEDSSNTYKK